MLFCFHAVKNRLHCKIGYFDLYGLDFMIDEDMKVSLNSLIIKVFSVRYDTLTCTAWTS